MRRLLAFAAAALAVGLVPSVPLAGAEGPNVIFNPDFSQGLRGWRVTVQARGSAPGYPRISALRIPSEPMPKCTGAKAGHPYLQMNVPGGAAGYVEQNLIVPVRPGPLRFRTWGQLEPVKVTVSIVSGPVVHQLLAFNPPGLQASPTSCSGLRPVTESLRVARYAGEAVGLRVRATSEGLHGAIANLNDLVLASR